MKKSSNQALIKATACLFLAASAFSPLYAAEETTESLNAQIVQQSVTIKGVVTDKNGEPIIGANVLEKGTTNGIITDFDGNYSLGVANGNSVLVFSYIGYKSQEVVVGSQKTINVVLVEDTEMIDEVVVIGYGTQKKGDVTSAVASVKAEDFTVGKIGDASELIKGKVAGLTIAKGSGDPTAESTIRLRGIISLEGSTTPLVLIDGVEGGLGTVAPENIASIDVLKDASAAAIYGTRGANGVIIITTKNGKRDSATTANYSGYMSFSQFGKTLDFFDAEDIRNGLTSYSDKGADTDWLDAVTRTAFTHNHNFNISGGSKNTTYSGDFTYRKEEGVILNTYNESMKASFDVSHWMLNDMLKVNLNIVKSRRENGPIDAAAMSVYRQAIHRNPTEPIYNEDGTHYENFGVSYYYNPVGILEEQTGRYTRENTRMTGNITFEPIKGWQTNLMIGRNTTMDHNRNFQTSEYYGNEVNAYTGSASQQHNEYQSDNLELTSKYHQTWGKHRFDALVGYSYQYNVNEGFYAYNRNFPSDFYEYNNMGIGTALKGGQASITSYKNDNTLIGFFGRVSYGFDNKYNVLVSVRREGSSKFGANNKWGTFPSVSLGWTISNEEFMKDLTWLDNLKLRAGYGKTGVIPGSSYESLVRYNYGGSYYYDNGTWKQGLSVASNPNPDLKWETSHEINIGLDWSVMEGRLSGSIDVYNKETKDMLKWYSVPTPPNLHSQTLANVGQMRNRGIEVVVNAIPVQTKDFEWKTTVTASHNSNKLVSLSNDLYETQDWEDQAWLGEPISLSTQRVQVGKAIGQFYGMKSVGVSENGLFLIENAETGEIEEFSDKMLSNDTYRQYLGNSLPKVYMGWTNNFRYKNWDLSLQFTGQFGFKILNEPRAFFENNSTPFNKLESVLDAPYGGQYTLSVAQKRTFVSYYLENGDFVKLSNMTLGYNVPLKENKYVKNVRAYLSADNLFCITGYSGMDPELSNGNITTTGIDYRDKYPSTRSVTFGVNVTF